MTNLISLMKRRVGYRQCILRITVCLFALTQCPALLAANQAKILIVNSDQTVLKYQDVENAFKNQMGAFTHQMTVYDLPADDNFEPLNQLIKNESPDLIYSIGAKAYQASVQFSANKPVLFSSVINWQRFPRSPNNYGVANELSLSQELSLLHYLLPAVRKIGVIYNPSINQERINQARAQMTELGLTLAEQTLTEPLQLDELLQQLLPTVDALWLIADPTVLSDKDSVEKVFTATKAHNKPVYTYSDAYTKYGASLVVSADTATMGRQAANLAQAVLLHEPIKDPVQTPAGSHITLNVCELGKLNVSYNSDALDAVNQLLECH